MSLARAKSPPGKRLEILVEKGTEELLPEEFYAGSGHGIWIEDQGADVLIKCYPEDPEQFIALFKRTGLAAKEVRVLEEEEQDYAALTLKYFRPIRIDGLTIIPPWSKKNPRSTFIVIEPGMAFGTGRHESTRLMIGLMKTQDFAGKRVLDLGCGSAILSLYAEKLDASRVISVDNDIDAVLSAKKNLLLNSSRTVSLACTSLGDIRGSFDIILANIDIRTFSVFAPQVEKLLVAKGHLIVSGILGRDRKKLLSLFPQLQLLRMEQKNAWRGFLFTRDVLSQAPDPEQQSATA
jgi:ribosomal protein L11 methyltransferase